jgi:hypothetical protein
MMIKVFAVGRGVSVQLLVHRSGNKYPDRLAECEMYVDQSEPKLGELSFTITHTVNAVRAFEISDVLSNELPEFLSTVDREWAKFQELHKGEAA